MNNKEQLKELVANSGNCVNLGRSLDVKNKTLYDWIVSETAFLDNKCKFTERVYCIINDITAITMNEDGTTPSRFENMFLGYCIKKAPAPPKVKKGRPPKFTKIQSYMSRNKNRNKELYEDGKVEGYDYVVCPMTSARMKMITSNYITDVLEMSVEEYDAKYPGIQKLAEGRIDNIKKGLKEIDPETGLTKYEKAQAKSRQTLSEVDESGLSGYDKKGKKTRATHMANVDEFGRNGYQRQAYNRVTTVLENGLTVEQNAHLKQVATIIANNANYKGKSRSASMASFSALRPIINYLTDNNIKYYFDNNEYGIRDEDASQYYFYDLTITSLKITIEYQSRAWHSNPSWDDTTWNNWCPPMGTKKSAQEALDYDYTKARALYKYRGITTYYVWEDTIAQDVEAILCLLKTMNMKY
jgi:hypothetical protein